MRYSHDAKQGNTGGVADMVCRRDGGMMARRYFTLEEASALLPRLREEVAALRTGTQELATHRSKLAELRGLPRLNGHARELDDLQERIAELQRELGIRLDNLTNLGVEIKDLDHGLVDFPSWREGRVVYLCWRLDEEAIAYWHEVDEGYSGRHPL